MNDAKKVHEGTVFPPERGPAVPAVGALDALRQIVESARECFIVHQEESTKRARLETYKETEIARIHAAERVLRGYFDEVFAERRSVFNELFDRLDRAMEAGDGATVSAALQGIVDVARTSPLANLGDLGEIRRALDDPDQVWDL